MKKSNFWSGKTVFITGHTGFKGGWLSLWLQRKGANVVGYSLSPPSEPNLYNVARIENEINGIYGDICDLDLLSSSIKKHQPDIVFHLAAQSLVRLSYKKPVETYSTNVMGTVNILEAIRSCESVKAAVLVTSDKCYENKEWYWGYREIDPMGGYDPYSSSKGCAELISAAYRNSYFSKPKNDYFPAIATARAGNVIGGGDWGEDRIIPDIVNALLSRKPMFVRNPRAIRPWQYVLDVLNGYIMLAERLFRDGGDFAEPWNFGPTESEIKPVSELVEGFIKAWGGDVPIEFDESLHPIEMHTLRLDSTKTRNKLGWLLKMSLNDALFSTARWYKAWQNNEDMYKYTVEQIENYQFEAQKG